MRFKRQKFLEELRRPVQETRDYLPAAFKVKPSNDHRYKPHGCGNKEAARRRRQMAKIQEKQKRAVHEDSV